MTTLRHHSLVAWQRADDLFIEGFARRHRRERLHFLNIAQGSLAEVGYCVHVAYRLGYIATQTMHDLERNINSVGAPLAGLVRSINANASAVPIPP
jgi:four helix bundle protein